MVLNRRIRIRTILLSSGILIVGIIHFGVGVGIVARYRKYSDTFQQQVSLSGYNIFIGIYTIAVGIIGLISTIYEYPFLSKITAIASFILGIFTLASLIAALALSGHAASYLHDSITDNMNRYSQDDSSIEIIDLLQTTYQCCGVNLWLDWSRIALGSSGVVIGRRRRRHQNSPPEVSSSLTRALKQKRQVINTDGTYYNLPASTYFNLPLSCCKSGGTANGNSLGGYCVFNASGSANSFYVSGCLQPVSDIGFSQITGIAVINTCLAILAFVYFAKLITVFRSNPNANNTNTKQTNQNQYHQSQQWQQQQQQHQQQQQQYPYNQYYGDYSNQNPYYLAYDPTYKTYL